MPSKLALCLLGLSLLLPACVEEVDAPVVVGLAQPGADDEVAAASLDEPTASLMVAEEKIEIDPTGKTTCTNDNGPCFTAAPGKCPDTDGKYSGACYCTHCEGGGVCETYDDHQKHDDKCKLKKVTAEEALAEL